MSLFEQILPLAMHHGRVLLFASLWIITTAAAVICVAWPVGQVAAPTSRKGTRHPINLNVIWRQAGRLQPPRR
jgi:hypothetical protein